MNFKKWIQSPLKSHVRPFKIKEEKQLKEALGDGVKRRKFMVGNIPLYA